MQRVIKFRGKRLDDKRWVTGYYRILGSKHAIYRDIHCWSIDPSTVGQFTGLTDKNGKEIYEGDVINYDHAFLKSGPRCVIEWHEYGISSFIIRYLQDELDTSGYPFDYLKDQAEDPYEVIGNKWDNPELLNKQS